MQQIYSQGHCHIKWWALNVEVECLKKQDETKKHKKSSLRKYLRSWDRTKGRAGHRPCDAWAGPSEKGPSRVRGGGVRGGL